MKIETERLMIREIEQGDGAAILSAMQCPQVALMHGYGLTNLEKVKTYIDVLTAEYKTEKYRTLGIAEKQRDKLIGTVTVDRDKTFPRAEISYWIESDSRYKGYATEAVKAVITYTFQNSDIRRIQAMHFTDNPASGRVLEKAGMIYEGTLRQYVGMGDTFFDCKMYSILRGEKKE